MSDYVRLHVPANHTVLLSLVHMDIGGQDYACPADWLTLFERTRTGASFPWRNVWLACNSYPRPAPVLLDTDLAVLTFQSDWSPQYRFYGFRLLYSFHQVSFGPPPVPFLRVPLALHFPPGKFWSPPQYRFYGFRLLYTFYQVCLN